MIIIQKRLKSLAFEKKPTPPSLPPTPPHKLQLQVGLSPIARILMFCLVLRLFKPKTEGQTI